MRTLPLWEVGGSTRTMTRTSAPIKKTHDTRCRRMYEGVKMNAVILREVGELVSRWGVEDVLSAFTQVCREEADKYTVTNTQGVDMKANELKLYHEGFIERNTDCIQCGRPKSATQGTMHNGWCSWCVRNRMEHRGYD